MIRGMNALLGVILTAVGLIVTFSTWTVDGWSVLAVVGVVLLGIDLAVEERSQR